MKYIRIFPLKILSDISENPRKVFGLLSAPGGQKVLDLSDQGVTDTGDDTSYHPCLVVVIDYPILCPAAQDRTATRLVSFTPLG
jgi:hypothetical protein